MLFQIEVLYIFLRAFLKRNIANGMSLVKRTLRKFYDIRQVYLPAGMFVVVSWVSFLIKPEVVPGRMALLVTLFLVLINIFNSVR